MSFWNDIHLEISIFANEIDEKKNEVAPDCSKIEKFSAALSNKFNSKHWKTDEVWNLIKK